MTTERLTDEALERIEACGYDTISVMARARIAHRRARIAPALVRAPEDEAEIGWTLKMDLLSDLRSSAGDWGYSLDLEAVEAISLEVECRILAALTPAPDAVDVNETPSHSHQADLSVMEAHQAPDCAQTEAVAWLPIETAPKDGTPFLTFSADADERRRVGALGYTGTPILVMAWLHADAEPYPVDEAGDWHTFNNYMPTHWMPLPAAPAPQEDKTDE